VDNTTGYSTLNSTAWSYTKCVVRRVDSQRQIKLGAILEGVGAEHETWLDPTVAGTESIDINWYIENSRLAEGAKFDLIFIIDSPFITPHTAPHFLNRLEPMTLLSAVAASTSHIGLVATLTSSFWEPYNAARLFASLDLISGGRAGWNVVTTAMEGAALNYSRERHYEHAHRYAIAREFVEVVRGLWDSYEDDAFPRDKKAKIFLDPTKQHALNYKGQFFSVAGPLAVSRSKQGHPVIFQAGESPEGRDLCAQVGEGVLVNPNDFEDCYAYCSDIKERARKLGRDPSEIKVMAGLVPVLAETDEEARQIEDDAIRKMNFDKLLVLLGRIFNYYDFSPYPPDGPFPDLSHLTLNSYKGLGMRILQTARDENLTLRQVALRFNMWRSNFIGSPETIAAQMERWFLGGACDGFLLRVTKAESFRMFRERVVPILQRKGLFRRDYESDTLRGNLGLPVPENRYTHQRRVAAEKNPSA